MNNEFNPNKKFPVRVYLDGEVIAEGWYNNNNPNVYDLTIRGKRRPVYVEYGKCLPAA